MKLNRIFFVSINNSKICAMCQFRKVSTPNPLFISVFYMYFYRQIKKFLHIFYTFCCLWVNCYTSFSRNDYIVSPRYP
jgi:hypothetical protein